LRLNVQEWLTEWFVARGRIGKAALEDEREALGVTDYFEAGWLTSMEVVEFVADIEQHCEIQFTDSDLQDSRFVTIAGLTDLILERSTQTSESK
jgi:acyl carrier protein